MTREPEAPDATNGVEEAPRPFGKVSAGTSAEASAGTNRDGQPTGVGRLEELHRKLREAVSDELPAAVALRHRLHADPRLSGDETDTAAEVVRAIGAGPGRVVAGTGRIVRIGGPGPAVALRAELDALPITERTGVAWASRRGAMHACGHDVHLAALVAVCRAIARLGAVPPVLAILQPREEGTPSGAEDIVAEGVLTHGLSHGLTDGRANVRAGERSSVRANVRAGEQEGEQAGIRAIVAAHVQPRLPKGVVAATPGPVNAATDEFEVTVKGRGGHAGYPHTTRDPVLAICQIVVSLQQIASRRFDPVRGAVCSVGVIAGGSAVNIVPETASARGTVRVLRDMDRAIAIDLIRQVVGHTAAAYGCEGHVRVDPGEPVLENDPALAAEAGRWLTAAGFRVERDFRSYGADDFSHYCQVSRGLMLFVGTADPHETGPHEKDLYETGPHETPPSRNVAPAEESAPAEEKHRPGLHHEGFLPDDDLVGCTADALIAGYLAALGPGS